MPTENIRLESLNLKKSSSLDIVCIYQLERYIKFNFAVKFGQNMACRIYQIRPLKTVMMSEHWYTLTLLAKRGGGYMIDR